MGLTGNVSRRTFLTGTAALGALAACTGLGSSPLVAKAEDPKNSAGKGDMQVKHMWCQMCGPAYTKCSTICYIKDGRWVHVEGNPEAGNNYGRGSKTLCAKGNSAMGVLYSPNRILYPMKRVGEKGEGKFEQCTWDEAMDAIAAKLKEQKEQYGAKSFGVLEPQWFPVLDRMGRRFLNVHGSPNYLHSCICSCQRAFSCLATIGNSYHNAMDATSPKQPMKTKLLVSWGYNTENSHVNQGDPWTRIEGMQKGMKVIDIRPVQDALAAHADMWIPIIPGTDCALAMAILNVIMYEDLYDHDFVENWCLGFDELKEHLKSNTPEWAAPITGVSAEKIYELAHTMASIKPMAIHIGNGIGDQKNDGHWEVACICIILGITGNLDIPGGAGAALNEPPKLVKTKWIKWLSEKLPMSKEDKEKGYMAGASDLVAPETPRWFQTMKTQNDGPHASYFKGLMSVLTEKPYPMRALFAQNTNPLSATRQPKKIEEALKKLDFYVVMDTQWNSSCDFADYVLPACTHYETSHQVAVQNGIEGTFIGINQKIAEPLAESRSDWEFYLDLAVRMGYGKDFWNGDMEECLREQLDGSGFTLEELRKADHGIFVERTGEKIVEEPKYRNYAKMFADLPEGKMQCYNKLFENKLNADETAMLSPLPVYNGPVENLTRTPELIEEYPLVMSDVHAHRLSQHSYYNDIPYLRELHPYPWCKINPATAKKYGIEDGDWMKVESPHGYVKLMALCVEGIMPGVLMSRRGWWQPCEELGLPGYGHLDGGSEVNVLYDSEVENFDPFTSAMSKQTLVKISKWEG